MDVYRHYAITMTKVLGGIIMLTEERKTLNHLVRKVKQQEETITQLVEIIAATNRRITDVIYRQQEKERNSKTHKNIHL